MKNYKRTRSLPACRIGRQPTAPQRVLSSEFVEILSVALTVMDTNFPILISKF
jgi:hypothetical protein